MFTTKTAVEKLAEKSQKIRSVFDETVRDLTLVNQDIAVAREANDAVIAKAAAENAALDKTLEGNTRLIDKITEFLS